VENNINRIVTKMNISGISLVAALLVFTAAVLNASTRIADNTAAKDKAKSIAFTFGPAVLLVLASLFASLDSPILGLWCMSAGFLLSSWNYLRGPEPASRVDTLNWTLFAVGAAMVVTVYVLKR
jgi:hypothetical protein